MPPDDEIEVAGEQGLVPAPSGVHVIEHPRMMHFYSITEAELGNLSAASRDKTLYLSFFTLSVGVLVSFLAAFLTARPEDRLVGDFFILTILVSLLASLFFGGRAVIAIRSEGETVKAIKG